MAAATCIQTIQELNELRFTLEEWRSQQQTTGRRRIPDHLWERATELALRHGVASVAKELKLGYYSLKKRVSGDAGPKSKNDDNSPTFLELLPSILSGHPLSRCSIELQGRRGAPIRVDVGGLDVAGLVALVRELAG